MNEKQILTKKLNESSFAMYDTALYLDTHPCDQEAIAYYHKCMHIRNEVMKIYNNKFGPLQIDQVNETNQWSWVNDPWPWEVGGNC